MSLQSDARECLLQAVRERNDVDVPPEDMATTKPSDPGIGVQDGIAWRETLDVAAGHLRARGHATRRPEVEAAEKLLNKALVHSQLHLQALSRKAAAVPWRLLLGGGLAAAVGAAIVAALRRSDPR